MHKRVLHRQAANTPGLLAVSEEARAGSMNSIAVSACCSAASASSSCLMLSSSCQCPLVRLRSATSAPMIPKHPEFDSSGENSWSYMPHFAPLSVHQRDWGLHLQIIHLAPHAPWAILNSVSPYTSHNAPQEAWECCGSQLVCTDYWASSGAHLRVGSPRRLATALKPPCLLMAP